MVAIFYVLAYLGFGAPYLVDGLNAGLSCATTFATVAFAALALAAWLTAYTASCADVRPR